MLIDTRIIVPDFNILVPLILIPRTLAFYMLISYIPDSDMIPPHNMLPPAPFNSSI